MNLELQTKVMHDNAYKGEDGYVRLQVALAEHSTDETVAYNNNVMSMTRSWDPSLFLRAFVSFPLQLQ